MLSLMDVNHLMHQDVLERLRRLLRKLEIQPDPARPRIATAPSRFHAPDAHLANIDADLSFPPAKKGRDLLSQTIAIPLVERRFALIAIGTRSAS